MSQLYADVTNTSNILGATVSTSHSASVSTAVINAVTTSLEVGDSIDVDLGYDINHSRIFRGYVKQIEKIVPNNTYNITAHDVLTRAVDYFIVSSNPDTPFSRSNIQAEFLVRDILELAGLTNYGYDATSFTFAVSTNAEINLVGAYDYCKGVADLLTWHIYADINGKVWFVNRKPHYIPSGAPELSQPGVSVDSPDFSIDDDDVISLSHKSSEKDLRNRIVVYGSTGIYAEDSSSTSYDPESESNIVVLPSGYYKSAALASPLLNTTAIAEKTADYNLILLNRLTKQLTITVVGSPSYLARNIVNVTNTKLGITNENYYVFSAEHNWGSAGYTVSMECRK